MEPTSSKPNAILALIMVLAIPLFRFRPLPRVWSYWLVGINTAGFAFVNHLEAQVLIGSVVLALGTMAFMYRRYGFVRLMGLGHLSWLAVVPWLAYRATQLTPDLAGLRFWLVAVCITNVLSLFIDTSDVTRFLRGERLPYYAW